MVNILRLYIIGAISERKMLSTYLYNPMLYDEYLVSLYNRANRIVKNSGMPDSFIDGEPPRCYEYETE